MDLKTSIKNKTAVGVLVKIVDNPAMLLMAKDVGLDFVFYDCEHGALSSNMLHDLLVCAKMAGIYTLVRTAQLAKSDIARTLDLGAGGVMVPMIENKEQAQQLVSFSKYPPLGKRSYSGGANTHYAAGGHHAYHMSALNEQTMSIVQIESAAGIEHIDEILSVEGIDGAIVGPCDLAISMGHPDDLLCEEELQAIRKVADACKAHHKAFGVIGSMELIKKLNRRVDLIISAIETNLIRAGLKQACDDVKALKQKEGTTWEQEMK